MVGSKPIELVTTADCLSILSPIWTEKHESAKRLKQRLATIFDWAKGAGHYPHENPINGIKKALPAVKRRPQHLAALPWRDLPEFMAALRAREGISARALEFAILTAARSGEARGARWGEVKADVWEVPAERMKGGVSHRVPLSDAARRVLDAVDGLGGELVFPSPNPSGGERQLSDVALKNMLRRMGYSEITVHGFRSTFRDWVSDCEVAGREVAEAALAHSAGSEVERAYARSDLFERRSSLMDSWGGFCRSEEPSATRGVASSNE